VVVVLAARVPGMFVIIAGVLVIIITFARTRDDAR
jgi:hypothetical protein